MQKIDFQGDARAALNDPQIRANFRSAMDGLMAKRRDGFPDPVETELLRQAGAVIKARCLSKLPDLLETLERNCQNNGIQVHWAETPEQANRIVLDIIRRHNGKKVIKGKSMVSEEMELNEFLEHHGLEVMESDLGEFIIQLLQQKPSHIIAPAIHLNRLQIAKLFAEKFPDIPYTDDVDQMTRNAREVLRRHFQEADIGISGVNFAVAETGTLCLVENEGNGRMSTTIPPVHIAVTGIEKVVERLSDIPPLLSLLTRSATGQPISTYFNMISSPRKEGERDGPQEVHLVLLDNGRSRIYEDQELVATLRCIRCGACMNHCPVYTRIGGHAYGSTIPGPIGSVLEPQKYGLDTLGALPAASTLCGACGEVCPVRIPLPQLLNRLRFEAANSTPESHVKGAGSQRKGKERWSWKVWSWIHAIPALYLLGSRLASRLRALTPEKLGPWTRVRKAPKPAAKTLHELARERGFDNE